MKGKICLEIAIALLILSLINASIVMAETVKYIPFPQEVSSEFYYDDIGILSQHDLDNVEKDCEIMPIYGEKAAFDTNGMIWLFEFSCVEDAKEVYSCYNKFMQGEVKREGVHIVGINTFGDESISYGDESISYYHPEGYSSTLFRNGRFVVFIEARAIKNSEEENIVRYTLPKMIDTKLEQIKVPTPTPQLEKDSDSDGVPDKYDYAPHDPNVQTKSDVKSPGFGAIFAIAGLLAVAYLLRRRE